MGSVKLGEERENTVKTQPCVKNIQFFVLLNKYLHSSIIDLKIEYLHKIVLIVVNSHQFTWEKNLTEYYLDDNR